MSTIVRDVSKPALILGGMGYLILLAAALIWFHMSPITILVLTLGCIALVVVMLWPIVAVHALIMILYVEGYVATGEGLTVTKVIGMLILAGWILSLTTHKRINLQFGALFVVMALFVVWCGILILYAYDDRVAISRTFTFAQLTLAAMMFASVVGNSTKVRSVYWAIVIWTTLSTIIAIVEYYTGLTPVAVGIIGNRNLLALYIDIAIVCAYLLHQGSGHPLGKLGLALSLPVLFLGLALTLSRSGLIVLSLVLLFLFYRIAREKRYLLIAGSIGLLCALTLFVPDKFWRRTGTIVPTMQRQEGTFGTRVRLWKVGLRMVADRPLVGVGPGNFPTATSNYGRGVMLAKRLGAHNSYVEVAAETGIIGLVLFLTLHLIVLRALRHVLMAARRREDRDLAYLAVAAEASLLTIMAAGLTANLEYSKYLWIFFGLTAALVQINRRSSVQAAAAAPPSGLLSPEHDESAPTPTP